MILLGRKSKHSNAKLRKINNNLELMVMNLSDQVENFKKVAFDYQRRYEELARGVKSLSYVILNDEYVNSQLGGDESILHMDVHQLVKYIEIQYRKKRSEESKLLSELVDRLNQKEQEVESLKVQLSRLLAKEKHLEEYNSELNNGKEDQVAENVEKSPHPLSESDGNIARVTVIQNKNIKPVSENAEQEELVRTQDKKNDDVRNKEASKKYKNMPQFLHDNSNNPESTITVLPENNADIKDSGQHKTEDESRSREVVSSIKDHIDKKNSRMDNRVMVHVVDLNDYMNKMTDVMWDIMLAIGKEGLSEAKDIRKMVVNKGASESAFNVALSQLRKMNIVDQERINTGWRWFHAYELSEIGRRIYLEKYKNNPIECEKQILKKEHTTALHGYCIKDASIILKAIFGYDEASTDRKRNSIKLYTGETYIPDIIAKKKEGALVDYFEVELGNHTQADFNKKCDKMLMVTKNLYFIVPDAETMNKILARQIGQWVLKKGGRDKLKEITIYLTTLKKLNEGNWDNIYHF